MIRDRSSIGWLYLGLGVFTDLYLLAVTLEFFLNLHLIYPHAEIFLGALTEPYLGAVGVYAVLKEIRKRREALPSLHRGERFVVAWLALLALSTAAVALTEQYRFDAVYQTIITNSLAASVIYLGSRINRP